MSAAARDCHKSIETTISASNDSMFACRTIDSRKWNEGHGLDGISLSVPTIAAALVSCQLPSSWFNVINKRHNVADQCWNFDKRPRWEYLNAIKSVMSLFCQTGIGWDVFLREAMKRNRMGWVSAWRQLQKLCQFVCAAAFVDWYYTTVAVWKWKTSRARLDCTKGVHSCGFVAGKTFVNRFECGFWLGFWNSEKKCWFPMWSINPFIHSPTVCSN